MFHGALVVAESLSFHRKGPGRSGPSGISEPPICVLLHYSSLFSAPPHPCFLQKINMR